MLKEFRMAKTGIAGGLSGIISQDTPDLIPMILGKMTIMGYDGRGNRSSKTHLIRGPESVLFPTLKVGHF